MKEPNNECPLEMKMKSLNLSVILSTAVLMLSGTVNAEETNAEETSHKNVHQNFAKRPYHQPLPDSAYQKQNEFEGATLVTEDKDEAKAEVSKHKQLRINMLGQRPYVEDIR